MLDRALCQTRWAHWLVAQPSCRLHDTQQVNQAPLVSQLCRPGCKSPWNGPAGLGQVQPQGQLS